MKVKLPAILNKAETRIDRSVKLVFETRELGGNDMAILFGLAHQEGWLLFSPNDDLTQADVPDEKPDAMMQTKTQAQRLRNIIFLLWKQGGEKGAFDDYYKVTTERIIEQLKDKLE